MWLFALFVAVPLIEIALFIQVGGLIGLWPTLLIVLLTAMAGTYLVRTQGAGALSDVKRSLNGMRDPTEPLAHGAMILVAGLLLLTPGFFTDAVGFALLTPPLRKLAIRELGKRIEVHAVGSGPRPGPGYDPRGPSGPRPGGPSGRGDTIEGEFTEVDPESQKRPTHSPSGWTRH
ncbi:UPF0716 protein FxsA [Tranquillimonas rosea]|uniref:UPF0716 protein FxsA n=1 Tax=Tranquillimonas rosea TaxID=641238 RepID=A0A1H9UED0_9RHOB|nr:FxsA family protein [Tranquillimonas rosea]SES07920.1 UPF0716 protein FxsA [Tranquillimonas rosea]